MTLDFSRPGKPTDNAFIEAFNGKQECLEVYYAEAQEASASRIVVSNGVFKTVYCGQFPLQDLGRRIRKAWGGRGAGRVGSRPRVLSTDDLAVARALLRDPGITVEQTAKRLGVAPSTLYRHIPGGREDCDWALIHRSFAPPLPD